MESISGWAAAACMLCTHTVGRIGGGCKLVWRKSDSVLVLGPETDVCRMHTHAWCGRVDRKTDGRRFCRDIGTNDLKGNKRRVENGWGRLAEVCAALFSCWKPVGVDVD